MPVDFESVTLDDVTRNFGRRRALHRVALTCRAGEIVALLGPNGAGKTTLLSIAAAVLVPSSGEVRYGLHTAASAGTALRARIGLLGHDLSMYPELSAAENLAFFARLHGVSDAGRLVDLALDRSGLGERRNDAVGGFSRGMRQRLAIERALLHDPRLVLLDEPFTGLDDAAAARLQARLRELRNRGCIVMLSTHDLEAVEAIAGRAIVLLNGRAMELDRGGGTLRERYRRASSVS